LNSRKPPAGSRTAYARLSPACASVASRSPASERMKWPPTSPTSP